MTVLLKEFIEKYTSLTKDEWFSIQTNFEKIVYQKNEHILREGNICRYFYFFESGLIRFYYNVDGEDVTKTFAVAPYCFTSKISFRNQSPSEEYIQALEETTVWRINYEQYRELEKLNVWNIFMRKLLNEVQEFADKLMLESKPRTAEKRYQLLLENYPPNLMQKIPLKHLASFLGIAPQSLSRIRSNLHTDKRS